MRKNVTRSFKIAVVGATGNVGREMLNELHESSIEISEIFALSSSSSIGKNVSFGEDETLIVESAENFDFAKADFALFACDDKIAKILAPKAKKGNCIVIDNSSAFRLDENVPLVIPEINGNLIKTHQGIIANPNCLMTQLAMSLAPLQKIAKIKKVVVSTYQSVSGAGKDAMDELYAQVKQIFTLKDLEQKHFPRQIAFNIIPKIGEFSENGYSGEEEKIMAETKKVIDPNLSISVTSVRVPVFSCHSASVHVEFEDKISLSDAKKAFSDFPNVTVTDESNVENYITPIEATREKEVFISRIRKDLSDDCSINYWVVSDNLLKGAALNAVQIAEFLTKNCF